MARMDAMASDGAGATTCTGDAAGASGTGAGPEQATKSSIGIKMAAGRIRSIR